MLAVGTGDLDMTTALGEGRFILDAESCKCIAGAGIGKGMLLFKGVKEPSPCQILKRRFGLNG